MISTNKHIKAHRHLVVNSRKLRRSS